MEGGASIGGGGGGVDAKAFHGAKDGSGLSGAEARHGGQGKEEQPLASGWGKGVGAELAAKKGEATIEQGAVGDSIEAGAVDFIAPLDDGAAPSPDGRDGRCGALKRVGLGWEHGTILARRGNAGNARWSAEGYGVWGMGCGVWDVGFVINASSLRVTIRTPTDSLNRLPSTTQRSHDGQHFGSIRQMRHAPHYASTLGESRRSLDYQ